MWHDDHWNDDADGLCIPSAGRKGSGNNKEPDYATDEEMLETMKQEAIETAHFWFIQDGGKEEDWPSELARMISNCEL